MATLRLISHPLCPYVQRAVIALSEKGVAFARVDIDLAAKPNWFTAISPLGKTPVLQVGETAIFESAVILEYLEETQPHPLHPADPLRRAEHRGWIEFGSAALGDIWILETTRDADIFESKRRGLAEKFRRIEDALGDEAWFGGAAFGLVDAVFAPVFRYFDLFDTLADLGVFVDCPKLVAWRRRLADRPSVRAAVGPDYIDLLRAFLERHDAYLLRANRA